MNQQNDIFVESARSSARMTNWPNSEHCVSVKITINWCTHNECDLWTIDECIGCHFRIAKCRIQKTKTERLFVHHLSGVCSKCSFNFMIRNCTLFFGRLPFCHECACAEDSDICGTKGCEKQQITFAAQVNDEIERNRNRHWRLTMMLCFRNTNWINKRQQTLTHTNSSQCFLDLKDSEWEMNSIEIIDVQPDVEPDEQWKLKHSE